MTSQIVLFTGIGVLVLIFLLGIVARLLPQGGAE